MDHDNTSRQLAFEHPVTGAHLEFDSPRPADQEALIEALRLDTELHPIED